MNRTLNLTIKDKSGVREYKVSIPTAGQLIEIETRKAILSNNNYGGLISSNTVGANRALDLIDMNAYLSVLCPNLLENAKVDDLTKLDVFDVEFIMDAYRKQFIPWVNEWQTALQKISSSSEKSDTITE